MNKVLAGLLALSLTSAPQADDYHADDYSDAVRELIVVSNSMEPAFIMMDGVFDQMAPVMIVQMEADLRKAGKSVSQDDVVAFIEDFIARLIPRVQEQILTVVIENYRKFLSIEEVTELTALMRAPIYQKYAARLPDITASAQSVGMELGKNVGNEVYQEVLKDYPQFQ